MRRWLAPAEFVAKRLELSAIMSNGDDKQTFHMAAVAGMMTGYVLGEDDETGFDAQHRLTEHVLGHPVWTHEFAEEALWQRVRDALLAQHPELSSLPPYDREKAKRAKAADNVMTYVHAYVRAATVACGETMTFFKGIAERTENPFESLRRIAPDKPILGVVVKE
jgi:hypothetical protein